MPLLGRLVELRDTQPLHQERPVPGRRHLLLVSRDRLNDLLTPPRVARAVARLQHVRAARRNRQRAEALAQRLHQLALQLGLVRGVGQERLQRARAAGVARRGQKLRRGHARQALHEMRHTVRRELEHRL